MEKIILLFMIMLIIGCANKAKVGYEGLSTDVKYKVVYEKGLLLMQDDVLKIMLKFERKSIARFFLTDTYEDINIYILSNKYSINSGSILLENPKIFFIKYQMHSSYGYMTEKSITINKNKGKIFLSGNLLCNKLIKGDAPFDTLNLSFNKLLLTEVFSISEMFDFDIYDKEIMHDNFNEFYNTIE
ncbi:MAG: hypothetical protein JW927_08400 [Deltaproteobacteria bacterium]|nr:hypothetical protein [Deltaproteobacteria bacterium]